MRRHGRTDNTQKAIVATLRKAGAFVHIMSDSGHGCPDILVCFGGTWAVGEIKSAKGKLTPDETKWIEACHNHVWILRSPEDALRMIGVV